MKMNLFETIPGNLFTVLTSKNKDIYVSSLLVLHDTFKRDLTIERETLTNLIANKLHSELFDFEDDSDKKEVLKDVNAKSHFIIRKLIETGWIETEYNHAGGLIEYVSLPPYSIQLLDCLYNIVNEEIKEYDSYMYAMYSSLINADEKYNTYRFSAIQAVYDKLIDFETVLKSLFHNLRRRYNNLASLKTINQILKEHFDSYQKEVIKQIYLPLKTKDSISRFKGPILTILTKWLRDQEIMDSIITQSIIANQYNDASEAKLGIMTKINYIVDKLYELEELIDSIDERNNTYVNAATQKMKYLLKNDRSSKGKLNKILQAVSYDVDNFDEKFLESCEHELCFYPQNYLNEFSLYSRKDATRSEEEEPLEIITLTDEQKTEMYDDWTKGKDIRKFSHIDIIDYMHKVLEDKKTISSEDIALPDIDALIYTMYSFIKGYDTNIFYKLELPKRNELVQEKEMVDRVHYELPKFNFTRRKQ